jgi:hypothetical protein
VLQLATGTKGLPFSQRASLFILWSCKSAFQHARHTECVNVVLQVRWLPRGTLKEHITGTEQRYTLRAATSRRPSWQESSTLRWFDPTQDTLTVRIPLVWPSTDAAARGGYSCPCAACPTCQGQSCQLTPGSTNVCCLEESCLDKGLR